MCGDGYIHILTSSIETTAATSSVVIQPCRAGDCCENGLLARTFSTSERRGPREDMRPFARESERIFRSGPGTRWLIGAAARSGRSATQKNSCSAGGSPTPMRPGPLKSGCWSSSAPVIGPYRSRTGEYENIGEKGSNNPVGAGAPRPGECFAGAGPARGSTGAFGRLSNGPVNRISLIRESHCPPCSRVPVLLLLARRTAPTRPCAACQR